MRKVMDKHHSPFLRSSTKKGVPPMNIQPRDLFDAAVRVRENAYAPYSDFRVGAALLTNDGRIFLGANMENSSYGATICAERAAVASAVSSGARSFAAIAVAGAPGSQTPKKPCPPCGICLQVLAEFCTPDFQIYLADGNGGITPYRLGDLLPHAFRVSQST